MISNIYKPRRRFISDLQTRGEAECLYIWYKPNSAVCILLLKWIIPYTHYTGRNVRFACLQIYCKSCYKFQICNDLPHLHACKLLICTRGKLGGKCGNGREAVRRKSVANPLQTNYFATSLHACKFNANTKFASDLHIRKSVDYLTIRLRAWDFYEVIVDEGEARINYHLIEIESE